MNAPDFTRIKRLFLAASELPLEERGAFLDAEVQLDAALRAAVEGQLAQLDKSESVILPIQRSTESTDANANDTEATEVIDRYHLLQKLGEGGFGTVWMAEQLAPVRRKVAVKVIKLGMDTVQVVARFEAERQALALMDHPNIARVFDGGATQSGRPFFAMELVRGIPITDYCNQARLSVRQRLALFRKVCHAVQHAHQRGVIHRDLKPGNVLVTLQDGEPIPKVIDFGIAKATSAELTQQTMFTELHQIVGTPEYMAPEQAELSSLDVDTRADVYSLGILLYELLTGTPPFDARELLQRGYAEMLRVIREVDPPKPSTRMTTQRNVPAGQPASAPSDAGVLSRWVRRDLDWIVMKAIEKMRDRRYESASALAADIDRHLANEPVLASPPTAGYRLRKFVRRYRLQVAAAAVMVASLVAGTVMSLSFAFDAGAQRDSAVAARESLASLIQVMKHADPFLSDDPRITPIAALDRAAQLVATAFVDDPHAEADVRKTLGAAYWRKGSIDAAVEQMSLGADLLESVPDVTPAEQRGLLFPRVWMLAHQKGHRPEVARWGRTLRALLDALAGEDPGLQRTLREMLSWSQRWRFPLDPEGARRHWQTVLRTLVAVPEGDPRWTAAADFAHMMSNVGFAYEMWADAADWAGEATRIYLGPARLRPNHMLVAMVQERRLRCMLNAGELAGARELARDCISTFAPVLPEDHWLPAVFRGWDALAAGRETPKDPAVIDALYRSLVELETRLGADDPKTITVLLGLVEVAQGTEAGSTAALRARLVRALGSSETAMTVPLLELALDDEEVGVLLRKLARLWREGVWSDEYLAEVRVTLPAVVRLSRGMSPDRRAAVARWLSRWAGGHIEKGPVAKDANRASRADLGELDHFLVEALADAKGRALRDAHSDLGQYYAYVEGNREQALRHARASVPQGVDERGRAFGNGWNRAILGLRLIELDEPVEALQTLQDAVRRLLACEMHINVYVDYAHRHLMRAYLHAGHARGEVPAALHEAAGIAVVHLRELLRGGATADSLNEASWAIVRCDGLDAGSYALAERALGEALAQDERLGHQDLPRFAETLNTLALTQVRTRRWSDAIATAQRVIELRQKHGRPADALDRVFLAMALHGRGDGDPALDAMRQARTLRTDDPGSPDLEAEFLFAAAERAIDPR